VVKFKTSFFHLAVLLSALATASGQQLTITAQIAIDRGEIKRTDHRADNAGAVVWLEPTGAFSRRWSSPERQYTLTQRDHAFEPHILIVPVGTRVSFPNEDPIFHNVFSLFQAKRFDLGLYEAGKSKTVLFDKPGISYIFCNIHSQMGAIVIALTAPYYAVSQGNGSLSIEHVPAGTYRLKIWAEGASNAVLEGLAREVVVTENTNLGTIDIKATPALNLSHTNKFGQPYDPEITY
jgi:plastocyanin